MHNPNALVPRRIWVKAAYAPGRVPRHCGKRVQPQKASPALPPFFATRRTIDAPHTGHSGVDRSSNGECISRPPALPERATLCADRYFWRPARPELPVPDIPAPIKTGRQDVLQIQPDEDVDGLLNNQLDELAAIATAKEISHCLHSGPLQPPKPGNLKLLQARYQGRLSIEFKSAHRSKGLEADYVVVLGMNSGSFSFSSQIEDDPLLDMVMPVRETFLHAEERRLFYVALTRARHKVVLITRTSRISRFIPELLVGEFRERATGWPTMRWRSLAGVWRRGAAGRDGKFGWFLGCSAFPECRHTEKMQGLR